MSGWRHDSEEGSKTETTEMKTDLTIIASAASLVLFAGDHRNEDNPKAAAEQARAQKHTTEEHSLPGRAGNVCLCRLVNKN